VRLPRCRERLLVRAAVALSVLTARLSERNQFRLEEPERERVVARMFIAAAALLAWTCRLVVRASAPFNEALLQARRTVFGSWLPPDSLVVIAPIWSNGKRDIVHTTCVNFNYLLLMSDPARRFLVSAYWAKFRIDFLWYCAIRILDDPLGRADRVIWLGNTPDEVRMARDMGLRSAYVNHNCFLNVSRFPVTNVARTRRYDAVLNANASRLKRHELAAGVPHLAYITYSRDEQGRLLWPVATFAPEFRNIEYLDERERWTIYDDARCGLVLSAIEGASYATVEFLLTGLPVVSTRSIGGREVWFDERNAILCDDAPAAVAAAVAEWRTRWDRGDVDPVSIRSDCLRRIMEFREQFVRTLQELFDDMGIQVAAKSVFHDLESRDMLLHSVSFQRTDSPHRHPHCQGKGWHRLDAIPGTAA